MIHSWQFIVSKLDFKAFTEIKFYKESEAGSHLQEIVIDISSVTIFLSSSSLLPLGRTGQISGKEALGISSIIRKLILFYPPTIMVSVEAELLQKYLEQLVSLSCAFLRSTTDATKDEDEKALFQEVSFTQTISAKY